jgi:hypothetical protein
MLPSHLEGPLAGSVFVIMLTPGSNATGKRLRSSKKDQRVLLLKTNGQDKNSEVLVRDDGK